MAWDGALLGHSPNGHGQSLEARKEAVVQGGRGRSPSAPNCGYETQVNVEGVKGGQTRRRKRERRARRVVGEGRDQVRRVVGCEGGLALSGERTRPWSYKAAANCQRR